MDFSTGNSGNLLRDAVIKTGPGCQQEGAFCQYLGTDVCPEVYSLISNGYVMERLERGQVEDPYLLHKIVSLLEEKVWPNQALPSSNEQDWKNSSQQIYGLDIPDWAIPTEYCLVHGDPIVSNCLKRKGRLILCDPRAPRSYVPQAREIDMAKIMQSFFGWESVAYGWELQCYDTPHFWRNQEIRRRVQFWLAASVIRIKHLVKDRKSYNTPNIIAWCDTVIKDQMYV